jgi:hypothetical protein
MRTYKFLGFFFFVLLLTTIYTPFSTASIGCEQLSSSLLKCWNEGTIENTTYYNLSNFQFANAIDRFNWTTYDYGIKIGVFEYLLSNGKNNYTWETDNSTYYRLSYNITYNYSRYTFQVTIINQQFLKDDYVNMTMRVKSNIQLLVNAEFFVYMKNINLSGNTSTNALYYNTTKYAFLNDTTKNYTNRGVTDFEVKVGDIRNNNIRFLFDNYSTIETRKNNGFPNNNVIIKRNYTMINQYNYDFTHFWIDVEDCRWNTAYCLPLGAGIQARNTSGTPANYTFHPYKNAGNKIEVQGFIIASSPWDSCPSPPLGTCYMKFLENISATQYNEIKFATTVDRNATCDVTNTSTCSQSMFSTAQDLGAQTQTSYTEFFNITCDRNYTLKLRANYSTNTGRPILHYLSNIANFSCPNETGDPIPSIVYPLNNTNYTSGNNSFNITCNAWDLYPIKNATIFSDFTGSWLSNFSWTDKKRTNATNFTNIFNITDTIYNIGCYACDNNGYCAWSKNITINNYTGVIVVTCPSKISYNLQDSGFKIEWLILLTIMGLFLLAISLGHNKLFMFIFSGSTFIMIGLFMLSKTAVYKIGENTTYFLCTDGNVSQYLTQVQFSEIPFNNPLGIVYILFGLVILLAFVLEQRKV